MTEALTAYFSVVGNDTFLLLVAFGIVNVVVFALYSFFD